MPRDTGFPSADAQDDFLRARRRHALSRVSAVLRREPDDIDLILPFQEVVDALGLVSESPEGLRSIPVDAIVGSVDRRSGFDRRFRPTSAAMRARFERIAGAQRRGESMPPIDVYRVGDAYFVRDGHHRVAVARAQGRDTIDAHVVEVVTRVPADPSLRFGDLPLKGHERLFHERVPLGTEARERMRLTDPIRFGVLAEGVEAWGFRLQQAEGVCLDRPTVARRWYEEEFAPVVEMLRDADLVERGETDADAYLRLTADRYRLMRTQEWSDEAIERVRRGR